MYPDLPKGLMRLSRRLMGPRVLDRAVRQLSELMKAAPPPKPRAAAATSPRPAAAPQPTPSPRPAEALKSKRPDVTSVVVEVENFGSNPGGLRMLTYLPASLPDTNAPLVVVLHGCGQHAAQFATDTGWLAMAERLGFAVVMPEQTSSNNAGRCFNWFRAEDVARDAGEVMSMREMVEAAVSKAHLDTKRVYVVGLSAGGAMAAALLAAYPELFAAGASVAGLPVGCASDVSSALARMTRAGTEAPDALAAQARAVGPAHPPARWPKISIWHGASDRVVTPGNADQMAAQFVALHGLSGEGEALPPTPGASGRAWRDRDGIEVELWSVPGMDHGYPIGSGTPSDRFVLPVGVDATEAIAAFWGLLPTP